MKKRVVIIHGWDGNPNYGWFMWLRKQLEEKGFDVIAPQLPSAGEPRINNWIPKIKETVGAPDKNTYFVGHSMGCQAIIRYLELLDQDVDVGGAVFVAGFLTELTNLEDNDIERSVATEWLTTPIDFNLVRSHLKKSIAIFSDNDQYVPTNQKEKFIDMLGSRIIIEHNKGHFSGSENIVTLPVVLEAVMEISK